MPNGGGGSGRTTGRRLRALPGLVALAAILAATVVAAAPTGAQAADVEAAFVGLVATERQSSGVASLAVEQDLVAVARRHSARMAAENRLYHNPALASEVVGWATVGENVGKGATVEAVHAAMMASATHRAEILRVVFTGVGVGVVQSNGVLWVTQVFRQRTAGAAQAAAPAPGPEPAPTAASAAEPVPAPAPEVPSPAGPSARPRPAPTPTSAAAARSTSPAQATTAAPQTTAATTTTVLLPPPSAPTFVALDAEAGRPAVDLAPLPVAASAPLPLRPGLLGVGTVAAALLWSVVAGLARVSLRPRFPVLR